MFQSNFFGPSMNLFVNLLDRRTVDGCVSQQRRSFDFLLILLCFRFYIHVSESVCGTETELLM
ncbi:unnamed protein product [Arabidopsis halleri]